MALDVHNSNSNTQLRIVQPQCDSKKTYFCSFSGCSLKFDRPSRLQWHIRQHTGEKPFPCDIAGCDKAYATSTKLKRHQKTFHKVTADGNISKGKIQLADNALGVNNIENGYASLTTTDHQPASVTAHRDITSTPSSTLTATSDVTTATTTIIGSAGQLSKQQYKYKCTEEGCAKSFKRRTNLYNHKVTQHEKRANFSCTFEGCGQTFTFPNRLKRHMKSHEGYNCKECGEKFSKWTEVRAHMASQHKKVHSCTQCSKTFSRPCDLHRHELAHSSLKEKYFCIDPNCSKSYGRVSTLRKHIKAQHHGELPYKCDQCPATFPYQVNLNRHLKFHIKQNTPQEKKSYPAKGHRKIPTISRLTGVTLSTQPDVCADILPAVHVSGTSLPPPTAPHLPLSNGNLPAGHIATDSLPVSSLDDDKVDSNQNSFPINSLNTT